MKSPKIAQITALDPAGVEVYDVDDPQFRLDKSDAEFVTAIHTNFGEFSIFPSKDYFIPKGPYGIERPLGHVDFYPNGGQLQSGCQIFPSGIISS